MVTAQINEVSSSHIQELISLAKTLPLTVRLSICKESSGDISADVLFSEMEHRYGIAEETGPFTYRLPAWKGEVQFADSIDGAFIGEDPVSFGL